MNANLALDTQKDTCGRRTYTVSEIAQLLGISPSAAYELVGTSIRVSKKSFDKWLDEQEL